MKNNYILIIALLMPIAGCTKSLSIDHPVITKRIQELHEENAFQYPLDEYFPEIPVTTKLPPKGEMYHAAEDSFSPPGTPVYAIGDGIISYSGRARGYGWLMIIDHPDLNVYSLYGHLSKSRWSKGPGEVKKGELIGYLGDAREAHTMVSHIHFGIRIGQKADYPRWGNQRWMAGYTTCSPDTAGWLPLSEIIGETEAMKLWKLSIQKREDLRTRDNLKASDFRTTAGKHNEKEDLHQIVQDEFGDDYRMADWGDIVKYSSTIEDWPDSLGLLEGEENSLFVCNDGYRIWLGRQYYISRFNHKKPRQFLAHDHIDDELVCLGSWFNISRHVLAVRR